MNSIVRELENMLRRLIREDIELESLLAAEPAYVKADPVQLEQIVMNLALNARDAIPDVGRITIRTEVRWMNESPPGLTAMRPGSYVVLSVEDTGTGMSEEVRGHIFEPFFTTKEVGKGTGLGLSTVYGIVQQAGASIMVDTQPGRGSVFSIYFPHAGQQSDEVPATGATDLDGTPGRETVLVVEDEELVRTMVCEALAESGYIVLESRNTEHAMDIAIRHPRPIQLLVTDIVMPRMNGRELARRLLPQRREMRVLFMSGYTEEAVSMESAFIKKPFTPDDLIRKVRAVLDAAQPDPTSPPLESRPHPSMAPQPVPP